MNADQKGGKILSMNADQKGGKIIQNNSYTHVDIIYKGI